MRPYLIRKTPSSQQQQQQQQRLAPNLFPILRRRIHKHPIMTETLPALSREERDIFGRMGTTMELFHNSFRNTWKVLYGACSSGRRPANMSIRQFLNTGSEFAHHLTMHHTIGRSTLPKRMICTKIFGRRAAHLSSTCAEDASI